MNSFELNKILGAKTAIVDDVPGVTRDRVSYEAEWNGKKFMLIDTGGWDRKVKGMAAQIAAQAERAIGDADALEVERVHAHGRTGSEGRQRTAGGSADGLVVQLASGDEAEAVGQAVRVGRATFEQHAASEVP